MSTTNNGRPLPWHDTTHCEGPKCNGPMVPVDCMPNGHDGPRGSRIACCACGKAKVGTPDEVAKVTRSARAWEMYEAGIVHTDRGCARCNGPLPLDRERLCGPCVVEDNNERQAVLL